MSTLKENQNEIRHASSKKYSIRWISFDNWWIRWLSKVSSKHYKFFYEDLKYFLIEFKKKKIGKKKAMFF